MTWTEPLPDDTHRIRHLNLTDGEPETIAEGKVQAARFLDETHILWQTLAEDGSITIDQHDLTTGNTTRVLHLKEDPQETKAETFLRKGFPPFFVKSRQIFHPALRNTLVKIR